MKDLFFYYLLLTIILTSCNLKKNNQSQTKKSVDKVEIELTYLDSIVGDFSFKNYWNYPVGVFMNKFGQLSCNGLFPSEIDEMKDSSGKIIADSLTSFYNLIDTTHLFHSLSSKTNSYEFGEAKYMNFSRLKNDTLYGVSDFNVVTHSTLHIKVKVNYINAWVEYIPISESKEYRFPLISGKILLSKPDLEKGIVKAKFDFFFINNLDPSRELFWKGLIYSKIND